MIMVGFALRDWFLFLAAWTRCCAGFASSTFRLNSRLRHAHDGVGHTIRFQLGGIIGGADLEFCLEERSVNQTLNGEVSNGTLQLEQWMVRG